MSFYNTFYFLAKFIIVPFSLENLKSLKSWEQIRGAKRLVRNTSARIFWRLGIKNKKVLSEKFLNKICKKYNVPHKKLPKEQIKPYLKCPTKRSPWIFSLPNHSPHNNNPGIWVKLLSTVKESKIKPKKKTKYQSIDWSIKHWPWQQPK